MKELNNVTLMPDRGPRYAETDLGRFPAEPANALSNLVFLLVLASALRRLRRERLSNAFYSIVLALLAVGWAGGTLYHATRGSVVWLALDFVPIALLCLLGAGRLAWQLSRRLRLAYLLGALPSLLSLWLCMRGLPRSTALISAGYSLLALAVAIPAALHCGERGWRGVGLLAGAVLSFSVALVFRYEDAALIAAEPTLGTHFLWHLFGGCATYLILRYLLDAEAARKDSKV